jgi:hypothetical protein
VFAIGILFHNHIVIYFVNVSDALGVFAFVVLTDEFLFPFLNTLPVGLEGQPDILNRIAIEYKLSWSGLGSCMYGGLHSEANFGE